MMQRTYIDRHLLIDRYLLGDLTESEQTEFEERLVWDTELIDEVELAERLREGLRQTAASTETEVAAPGLIEKLSYLMARPQYAAAASFLLAIGLTLAFLQNPLPIDRDRPEAFATTEIVPIVVLRSSAVQKIAVNEDSWTVLLVDTVRDFDSYRISVRRDADGAEPVWTDDDAVATHLGGLAVGMPGHTLSPGRYVIELDGVRESDDTVSYDPLRTIVFEAIPADQ